MYANQMTDRATMTDPAYFHFLTSHTMNHDDLSEETNKAIPPA